MTREEFKKLEPGDRVRIKGRSEPWMIISETVSYGELHYHAVKHREVRNPDTWDLISAHNHEAEQPPPEPSLLPCPNPTCGSGNIDKDENNLDGCWVFCGDCDLTGPTAKSHALAAKAWNALKR